MKSGKKPGGQLGQPRKTLGFSYDINQIDEFVEHILDYCNSCGKNLSANEKKLLDNCQIIGIPPIKPVRTQHQIFSKFLAFGFVNKEIFPADMPSKIQYGPNIEATITPEKDKKAVTFQKQLIIHQQKTLLFLHHSEIPPDNTGSERAIRNIKVKQKISEQFKSTIGVDAFAIIRLVIDTTNKSGKNILQALFFLASQGTE